MMATAVLFAAVVLLVQPACPVYAMFHVLCPGCGGTRALMALLRGNLGAAWRLNALVVCEIPLGLGYVLAGIWRRGVWPEVSRGWWITVSVGVALFMEGRNFFAL